MTGLDILGFEKVNAVEESKVQELVNSITTNGYDMNYPILVYGNVLLTGSHRLAAIEKMFEEDQDVNFECALDVSDIITDEDLEEAANAGEFDFDALFTGTWVEEYKEGIEEW